MTGMQFDDETIDMIGSSLEARGLSHSEIDEHFLAHYGVKGMKWGVRRAFARGAQATIDIQRRVASGTGNRRDRFAVANKQPISSLRKGTQAVAQKNLDKNAEIQAKIEKGEKKVKDFLFKYGAGVSMKSINFDISEDPSTFTRKNRGKGNRLENP